MSYIQKVLLKNRSTFYVKVEQKRYFFLKFPIDVNYRKKRRRYAQPFLHVLYAPMSILETHPHSCLWFLSLVNPLEYVKHFLNPIICSLFFLQYWLVNFRAIVEDNLDSLFVFHHYAL